MKNKFEAVLFDLGGVVLNIHFDRCFQTWAKVANQSVDQVSKAFVFDDTYAAHEVSKITASQYHIHICKLLNAQMSFDQFRSGWNSIYGDLIGETIDLIGDLKKSYKVFAFTNSNLLHREVWVEKYQDALKKFDQVFCSSQLKLRKPEAEAFAKITAETGIPKERVVFVDDLEANILGGERYGFKSILFSNPKHSTQKIRDLLLG